MPFVTALLIGNSIMYLTPFPKPTQPEAYGALTTVFF